MSKHTPGPLRIENATLSAGSRKGHKYRNVRGHFNTMIANSVSDWAETDKDARESFANAQLIAAAPELLEALELALPYIPSRRDGKAKAAIAKAQGGTV